MKRRALEASGATQLSRALACVCATLPFACGSTTNGTSGAGGSVAVGGMGGSLGSSSGAGGSSIIAGSSSGGTKTSTGGAETSVAGSATSTGGSSAGAGGLVDADAGTAGGALMASTAIVTNRNDNVRSAANLTETSLAPATVNASGFGLLFSRSVDAQIYAQPLYLGGLTLNGQQHNVVFVATAQNSVYAFDADNPSASAPLWQKNMGAPGQTTGFSCTDMTPEVGITSTPVIDQQAGNLYLVAKGEENGTWVQRIHILDILTGGERPGSPVVIAASVPGTGDGSTGGKVSFNAKTALNRPGLLLQDGTLYLAFASHCDSGPYHGWVLGYQYDGAKLTQTHAFTVSPNGSEGGIWQAGVGLSSDGPNIYFAAGNGSTNPNSSPPDLSESVVRLRASDFTAQDYWTPTNYSALNKADSDLSSGATLLPHDLIVTGSKDGRIYVLDRANLGKFNAGSDAILQTLTTPGKGDGQRGHVHGGPIYYKDPTSGDEWVLIWPESSPLMRYKIDPSTRTLTGLVTSPIASPGHPGGVLSLSANGTTKDTAVLWAAAASGSNPDGGWHMAVPGTLYAIDPSATPPSLLWSSDQNFSRDAVGDFAKFNTPTVANGHVYLATFSGALRVYGLRP